MSLPLRPPFSGEWSPAPDFTHGYLRVPLAVWSTVYCRTPFTRRQLQLISVVIRESWGWRAPDGSVYLWTRRLTPRQFAEITGLSTDRLSFELRKLIHLGVLREQDGRYQFVPQPRAWAVAAPSPSKRRPERVEYRLSTAVSAVIPPGLKRAKKRERNVAAPERALSPAGDNRTGDPSDPCTSSPWLPVLEGLAGPLTGTQREVLGRWLQEAGINTVWREVGPLCLAGPRRMRLRLGRLLARREAAEARRG